MSRRVVKLIIRIAFIIRLMNENIFSQSAWLDLSDDAQWLSIPEVADSLGVRQRDVRTMLAKHELVALHRGENGALAVHRSQLVFTADSAKATVLASLKGTFTALDDAGFSDEEKLAWITASNPELGCAPVEALRNGRIHSVRRAIITAGI